MTHHLAGNELGVEVDCAVEGPRIRRWRVDRDGNRSEDAHSLTPVQFDALWKDVDATGWPNLRSCSNGSHDKRDPLYRFTIKDDVAHAAFQCQARAMPFPYSGLVDPLDLAAQDGHGQLGDDEPAAAKALAPEARRE